MSITFHQHRHEQVAVHLTGVLTWPAAMEFVDTVDGLVERYFYHRIEVLVSSPGGLTAALDHIVRALERWRAQGVVVDTRVVDEAASAAALLVALGDERVAEPDARLLFHTSRIVDAGHITAQASSHIRSALTRVDRTLIERLVTRALRTTVAPAHRADPGDQQVLERLAAAACPRATIPPRSMRALTRTLGRTVDDAVRHRDRKTLARLYRALAETDSFVSAPLARTLRLVDHVGTAPARPRRHCARAGLTVPEWAALYPPDGTVPRELLTRHTLALGETGAGKTASAVLPVLAAAARAPAHTLGCTLVIDPKRELAPVLAHIAPGRVHHIRAENLRLNLMSGPRWSLDADLAAGRWTSAATRMLLRVHGFIPSSPLYTLAARPAPPTSRDAFFDHQGTQLARDVLALVLAIVHPGAPDPDTWLDDADEEAHAWVEALCARALGSAGARGPNALALTAWALDGALTRVQPECPTAGWLCARVALQALARAASAPGEARDLLERIVGAWAPLACVERQHAGVLATARNACAALAAPAVAHALYFGCEPGARAGDDVPTIDFAALVSRAGGDGRLVVFQPARDDQDRLVALALKALFFEAVLADPDRVHGAADLPLVGYVADEFHRYVTSDPVHGEGHFLDSARSHGAFVVLITQSVSSLELALAHGAASPAAIEAAVSVLWNNTATKLIFRSTDAHTADRLAELCPHHPGWPPLTRLRPLSTLAPGECYAALADGRLERRQLRPLAPVPGSERATARSPAPGRRRRPRRDRPPKTTTRGVTR